ncbi:MAG: ADP-forming succinate--CoA ligase subunit beta [Bacteroidales bacterium]|nr:ADP-forming succinate--CoA ligase subunit beta [Bacteroidales bacterium]
MNLHEYQAKMLLKQYGVLVPVGYVASNSEEALMAAKKVWDETKVEGWAIKAQIHAGGRGKAGGIKIARHMEEVELFSQQLIGSKLITPQTSAEGKLVRKILIEQNIYYPGEEQPLEFYVSFLLNKALEKYMFMYSIQGGMEIEVVAEKNPELIFTEIIDPMLGLMPYQARRMAYNLGLKGVAFQNMVSFLLNLYRAAISIDANLVEINPVLKASDGKIFAADAKVVIDNNALFRHPEIAQMDDPDEMDSLEREATHYKLNYIKLNGNVGCMVNGAGLAMATMDVIKMSGGEPANFLDVGGSADVDRVEKGFRIILKDPNVRLIFVNIFGGIVRCDRVANGIVQAYRNIGEIPVPVVVRLQGTNAEEGKQLIAESGLKVYSVIYIEEAAELINKLLS